MNKLKCGNYYTIDQKEALYNYLKGCYEKFLKNDLKSGKFSAEKYDRKNLTKKLVKLLKITKIIEQTRSGLVSMATGTDYIKK